MYLDMLQKYVETERERVNYLQLIAKNLSRSSKSSPSSMHKHQIERLSTEKELTHRFIMQTSAMLLMPAVLQAQMHLRH